MNAAFVAPLPFPSVTRSVGRQTCARRSKYQPRAAVATPPPPSPLLPPNEDPLSEVAPAVVGRERLQEALDEGACCSSSLIVVMFHARWCRVCKTLALKLPKVAPDYPHVKWLRVDFAEVENKKLVNDMGIRLLPTFRFYAPGMSIDDKPLEEFTAGPFAVDRLVDRLKPYSDVHG